MITKSIFQCTLAFAACSVLATAVFAAPAFNRKSTTNRLTSTRHAKTDSNKQKVTFEITGADKTQVDAINKALTDHGLTAKLHEGKGKGKPLHLSAEVDRGADLSPWIKAVDAAGATPKSQPAPTLQLIIYAPINKESGTQALAQLEKVKGVDIKHSTADVKMGELHVRLTGNDHVTADDISSAVQSAGIVGHFTKSGKGKS